TMRSFLFAFLSFSMLMKTADALQCYKGFINGDDRFAAEPTTCNAKYTEYCYSINLVIGGKEMTEKSCDFENVCKKEGSVTVNGSTGYCCKGDLCNAAVTGSSLLVTALVAAVALWMRD
ncbi:hypothetical protein PENTCL1PPCAC_8484, partial [Pristionchus entomophagus]